MLVKLLSKLPTSVLIRILLAERSFLSTAATRRKTRANEKLSEYRVSYDIHLFLVKMYEDLNIQKPIEKPKFLQEIEADLEVADHFEEWVRKIDEALWQLEVADSFNSK